jgi:hypothetical protein
MNSTTMFANAEISDEGALSLVLPNTSDPARQSLDLFPYGHAVNGNPRTWTGSIVALDEWRRLSEWGRHGSTGKIWNGLTRQWEPYEATRDGTVNNE